MGHAINQPHTSPHPVIPEMSYRFTVADYQRMHEIDAINPAIRTELFEGGVLAMAAIGARHQSCVSQLAEIFFGRLQKRVIVNAQGSVQFANSQFQPDLTILQCDPSFYRTAYPQAGDVLLIVEVVDSQPLFDLKYDCQMKGLIYAESGIPEFWMVDLARQQLEVHRHPSTNGYQIRFMVTAADTLACLAFPEEEISLHEILSQDSSSVDPLFDLKTPSRMLLQSQPEMPGIYYEFTVAEYQKLYEAGVIPSDVQTELLFGHISGVSPVKPLGQACIDRLNRKLHSLIQGRAIVGIKNSIVLMNSEQLQIHLTLLKNTENFYEDRSPEVSDILLVIEVSDSVSMAEHLRSLKGNIYARSGIGEFWMVDSERRKLEVYRDPSPKGYQTKIILTAADQVTGLAFPEESIALSEILG